MNMTRRDRIATVLVAAATLIYGLWLTGPLSGLTSTAVAMVVLALGFLASASAVVPGFGALLRGSRAYLAAASGAGLVAFVSGVLAITGAGEQTLAILVVATIGLWAAATVRHSVARRPSAVAMG